jgi:hypothetical protein
LIVTNLDKNFITAWKSITKLVIFLSFLAKCCKIRIIYSLASWFAVVQSFCITRGKLTTQYTLWGCQFPVCNTKWLKNGKRRKAILSTFYNISQRDFGTLLNLWSSFKLLWNFDLDCFDENLDHNANAWSIQYVITEE